MATETTSSSVKFSTPSLPSSSSSLSVLMVGAGEYNCGYVLTKQGAAADKPAGVTALVLYDLKRRFGYIQRILLADVSGSRVSGARQTMEDKIGKVYKNMNTTIECYPDANVEFDGNAYLTAMDTMKAGDAVIIFTPDPSHFSIAKAAIERHLHVLVAKPLVKTLQDHLALESSAKEKQVLLVTEYHKRFDPMYSDARARIQKLGWFSFYSSIMTQRKDQLDTFAGWAGKASDISYYLNSHHIDIHCWSMEGKGRPTKVVANASYGVANDRLQKDGIEDTITLLVTWDNYPTTSSSIISSTENSNGTVNTAAIVTGGHAIYTASWIAPYADCHTQQSFHYMGQKGEIRVDQAHRGYSFSADTGDAGGTGGLATLNPLYMRYTPDNLGYFAGQHGYGYRSIEAFIDTCRSIQDNEITVNEINTMGTLATANSTLFVTAILEAGRQSLDKGGIPVHIIYDDTKDKNRPVRLE